MLHAREDYQRIQDPENKIPENEPVFLLRGQDMFAPELLLRWSAHLRLNGGNVAMAIMVEDHAMKMLQWQADVNCHVPNLPAPGDGIQGEVYVPEDLSNRRFYLHLCTKEELAIRKAISMIEELPANALLSDATVYLDNALNRVGDWVDAGSPTFTVDGDNRLNRDSDCGTLTRGDKK